MLPIIVGMNGNAVLIAPVFDSKTTVSLLLKADSPLAELSMMKFLFSVQENLLRMN